MDTNVSSDATLTIEKGVSSVGILKDGWREQLKEDERQRRIIAFILIGFTLIGFGIGLAIGLTWEKNSATHMQRKDGLRQ